MNLIKSYLEKNLLDDAREMLDEIPHQDIIVWMAMIKGYASWSHNAHAWALFHNMAWRLVGPNSFMFSSILKACKGIKALACDGAVHYLLIKHGVDGNVYVDNALMDVACGTGMDDACWVFQAMLVWNDVSWMSLIDFR